LGKPVRLSSGVFIVPSVASGVLGWDVVEPWIIQLRYKVGALPGHHLILVDARDAVDTTQEARVQLLRQTRTHGLTTRASAVFGTSVLMRLSVAALALVANAPVKAFKDEGPALAWLNRVGHSLTPTYGIPAAP